MWNLCEELRAGRKLGVEQDIHIASNSSNTQFGKYELFQCIKSAEKLFTFVVLVFCQCSALTWVSNPMTKGVRKRVWPEARDSNKAASSQIALGCQRATALISCHFLSLIALSRGRIGSSAIVRKWEHTAGGKGDQQHSSGPTQISLNHLSHQCPTFFSSVSKVRYL